MNHPNATLAGGTTSVGVIVVWLLGRYHVNLSAESGAAIAGGASTILLWIGRNGLLGAWNKLLRGKP